MPKADVALDLTPRLGESPVWAEDEQVLYWTDIPGLTFNRFDPAKGENLQRPMTEKLGSFALRESGGFVAGMESGFVFLDFETGRITPIDPLLKDRPDDRLNDGRCDRAGRFFAGVMDESRTSHDGELFRLDVDGTVTEVAKGVMVSNGLAWSPDNSIMYWADTRTARETSTIWAFDYDIATGTPTNQRVFAEHEGPGLCDGACVDSQGFYWSAAPRAQAIIRYKPTGEEDGRVDIPQGFPTMCAFGGPSLDTLYITTAWEMLTEEQHKAQPLAGALYEYKPGVTGLPEPKFKG